MLKNIVSFLSPLQQKVSRVVPPVPPERSCPYNDGIKVHPRERGFLKMGWASARCGVGFGNTRGESIKFRQSMLHPCFIHAILR
jgi:hypothetical protein